jgi:hypothetical protein
MPLDWKSVKPEHVRQACESMLRSVEHRKLSGKRIVVLYKSQQLPAKQVLTLAYKIANGPETYVDFTSGEGTIHRLKALGFVVTRVPQEK